MGKLVIVKEKQYNPQLVGAILKIAILILIT